MITDIFDTISVFDDMGVNELIVVTVRERRNKYQNDVVIDDRMRCLQTRTVLKTAISEWCEPVLKTVINSHLSGI